MSSLKLLAMAVIALTFARTCLLAEASAQGTQNVSSYTSTAAKDCRKISKGETVDDGGTRLCHGPAGLAVIVSEDDLRETVLRRPQQKGCRERAGGEVPGSALSVRRRRRLNGAPLKMASHSP